jgi:hypothetical protein
MWQNITDIARTAAAMLSSGKIPPNTPENYAEEMKKLNFLTSKKFFATFWSIIILISFHITSLLVLFVAAWAGFSDIVAALVTVSCKFADILLMILASFLGIQTAVDIIGGGKTDVSYQGENKTVTKKIDEKIIKTYSDKYKGDPSYAPLNWINQNV